MQVEAGGGIESDSVRRLPIPGSRPHHQFRPVLHFDPNVVEAGRGIESDQFAAFQYPGRVRTTSSGRSFTSTRM